MRTLMTHERSELTYPSETVPPIQAGFATAMNRPLCSFVSAMRFGAPQRQDIENPSCRSVRFDLRGLFYTFTAIIHAANRTIILQLKYLTLQLLSILPPKCQQSRKNQQCVTDVHRFVKFISVSAYSNVNRIGCCKCKHNNSTHFLFSFSLVYHSIKPEPAIIAVNVLLVST